MTNDIDIVAGVENRHIAGLLAAFPPDDFYLSEDAVREGIRSEGQFNIIHPGSGLKVDVIVRKDTPFEQSRFTRRRVVRPDDTYAATFASSVSSDKRLEAQENARPSQLAG